MHARTQTPQDTTEFCLAAGDDHWESLEESMAESIAQVNQLASNPRILLRSARMAGPNGEYPYMDIHVFLGGDLKFLTEQVGIKGCNCSHPCVRCKVRKQDCCVRGEPAEARTLEENRLLTHTALGVCPACKMQIVEDLISPTPARRWSSLHLASSSPRKASGRSFSRSSECRGCQGTLGASTATNRYSMCPSRSSRCVCCISICA